MPFTASHPAAILPLRHLGLPTSALAIGSLVPDLPYFLGFLPHPPSSATTHTLTGVLTIDLLFGLLAFAAWHAVLVRPLVWAAPASLQARLGPGAVDGLGSRVRDAAGVARIAVAVLLGALTHVAWDAFTHAGGWGIRTFPWLSTSVLGLPVQRWMHAGFSILGLVAIGWVLARWWRQAPTDGAVAPRNPALHRLGVRAFGVWVLFAVVEVGVGWGRAATQLAREAVLIKGLTDFITGLLMAAVVVAVVWHAVARWRPEWLGGVGAAAQTALGREVVRSG